MRWKMGGSALVVWRQERGGCCCWRMVYVSFRTLIDAIDRAWSLMFACSFCDGFVRKDGICVKTTGDSWSRCREQVGERRSRHLLYGGPVRARLGDAGMDAKLGTWCVMDLWYFHGPRLVHYTAAFRRVRFRSLVWFGIHEP